MGDRFVFCLDEPVFQILTNSDVMSLSNEFDLVCCNGELHGSRGEAERQSIPAFD